MANSCKECAHFVPSAVRTDFLKNFGGTAEVLESDWGECHEASPRTMEIIGQRWPICQEDELCGQYTAIPGGG